MHTIKAVQNIPISLQEAWNFFSSPKNLQKITPPDMGFIIKSELPAKMYPGMFIQYTVKPLLGIPLTWVTEITQVKELEFFVDEQRVGPYAIWHHQHFFKEIPGGVECTDIVDYKLPLSFLGDLVHPIVVAPKIKEIFEFRKKRIVELFGEYKPEVV
ncbi:MAG: SRPBCC family protein [Luteibaculaceae bacterium]